MASQNPEFMREEYLRKVEEYLQQAVDTAKQSNITLDELVEIMTMLYEEGEE